MSTVYCNTDALVSLYSSVLKVIQGCGLTLRDYNFDILMLGDD